jgi:hypothetical protein
MKRIEPDSKYSREVFLKAVSTKELIAEINAPLRSLSGPDS